MVKKYNGRKQLSKTIMVKNYNGQKLQWSKITMEKKVKKQSIPT